MNDYLERLAVELRSAAEREQAARVRRRPRPSVLPRLAVAAATAAAAVAIALTANPGEPEREVGPAAVPELSRLAGTYEASRPRTLQLLIGNGRLRLLDMRPRHEDSGLLGFARLQGDRLTVQVDARAGNTLPNVGCYDDGAPDSVGTYRVRVDGGTLRFRLVEDPCSDRVELLTGRTWRRDLP